MRQQITEERVRPLGNIRYLAPGEPEPDSAEWEYRKTSKKCNRVYIRRPITLEAVRRLTLEALSQIKPEVREIVVKVGERPAVRMDGKVHQKFTEILDLAAQRMEVLMVGPAGCGKSIWRGRSRRRSGSGSALSLLLVWNERGADHQTAYSHRRRRAI